jgi:hypothetical protein
VIGKTAWLIDNGQFAISRVHEMVLYFHSRDTPLRKNGTRPCQIYRMIAEDADAHRLQSRSARRRAQSRLAQFARQPRSPSQSHSLRTAHSPRRRRTSSRSSTRPSSPRSRSRPPSPRSGGDRTRSWSQTSSRWQMRCQVSMMRAQTARLRLDRPRYSARA